MDSGLPAAADTAGARSGGKVIKRKTISHRTTPYDRPEPSNWRNGLLFPAKFVAGGATKLISSIWNPKTWGSNGVSSETDSDSEVGIEDECVPDANLPDGDAELNQNKGSSSGKSEIFYLIEQLIMLEHFSREERDKLIEIINSRVVDCTMKEGINAAPKNPDIIEKTITEARNIISENMAGTSSKSNLDNSVHGNMDNHSNASWKIQNEMQRLHYKVTELMKPDEHISLEALKSKNETANLVSNDMNTQDDAPTETFSLPTIEEQHPSMGKQKRKSTNAKIIEATGELINCDDCVLVKPDQEEERLWVARVKKFAKCTVYVSWYYRPEDTIYGRLPFQAKNELLSTEHYDWVSIKSIEGKCKVHSEQAYTSLKEAYDEDFLCRSKYDVKNKVLTEDTTFSVYCKCQLPHNPDYPMIRCNTCKDWFHPPCVGIHTKAMLENTPTFICEQCSNSKDDAS